MAMTKAAQAEQDDRFEDAKSQLLAMLSPGDRVATVVGHVSASGMSRWIRPIITGEDGEPEDISWLVNRLFRQKMHPQHEGVKMDGCGMDMAFALVYNLSMTLFAHDGWNCLGGGGDIRGIRCPSNHHSNYPGTYGEGLIHHDGYALQHRSL